MKKISMVLFAAALFVSFAACNKTKEAATEAVDETATEVVEGTEAAVEAVSETATEAVEAATEAVEEVKLDVKAADVLKTFEAYAKEYAEAFNNISKDPIKYSKLANQLNDKIAEVNAIKDQLTAKDLKSLEKAMSLITQVNSAGR